MNVFKKIGVAFMVFPVIVSEVVVGVGKGFTNALAVIKAQWAATSTAVVTKVDEINAA